MFQCAAVRVTSNFPLFNFMSHGIQMRRLMMPFNGIYTCYPSQTWPQPDTVDSHTLLKEPVINSIPIITTDNRSVPPRGEWMLWTGDIRENTGLLCLSLGEDIHCHVFKCKWRFVVTLYRGLRNVCSMSHWTASKQLTNSAHYIFTAIKSKAQSGLQKTESQCAKSTLTLWWGHGFLGIWSCRALRTKHTVVIKRTGMMTRHSDWIMQLMLRPREKKEEENAELPPGPPLCRASALQYITVWVTAVVTVIHQQGNSDKQTQTDRSYSEPKYNSLVSLFRGQK